MGEKTILLVEDNPNDEELTLRTLHKSRIANKVAVVRDGAQALDYLFGAGEQAGRDLPVLPQLILLDLKLPKIDGLEVLRRLRAHPRTRLLPVAILTSYREEKDMLSTYDLGANSYIHKPVDFKQLSEAVRQLGLAWLVLNAPQPERKS